MKKVNQTILRTALSLIMGLCLSIGLSAQNWVVTGVVQDEAGEPITGASVTVRGTKNGAVTDLDGRYRLNVTKGATLVASFIGYKPAEGVADTHELNFTLKQDSELLDEVVVLGYGASARKQDLSGAVGVISNADELAKRPVTSTEAMLQGQLPGVTVSANGGDPTAGLSLTIRGSGTPNGESVMWVVDGVPGAPITSMSEIESITVLKDAASAAIYGAQSGTGGVVLVTTKKGAQGATSISYEGQFGFRKAYNLIKPLDAQGEIQMRKMSYANAGLTPEEGWDVTKNPYIATTRTNWMDEIFRTAPYQRHNVVLNSGTATSSNRLSLSYDEDQGTLINTYKKTLGIRYNGSFQLNKWVTVRENLTWSNYQSRGANTDSGYYGPILSAIWMPASAEVYNPLDGTYGGVFTEDPDYLAQYGNYANIHGDVRNPVRLLRQENRYNRTSSLWTTTSLEIGNIVEGLKLYERFTYNVDNNFYKNFTPIIDEPGKPEDSNSLVSSAYRTDKWVSETTLNYDNSFGRNQIGALLSFTADHYEGRYVEGSNTGFPDEDEVLQYFTNATGTPILKDELWGPDNNIALVGRVSYSYDDRYFVTASWRRDWASRLVKQSNHGDFPGVTAAWKLSNEKFFDHTGNVNLIKFRGSWGKVGSVNSVWMGYKSGLLSWDSNKWHQAETPWYGITLNNNGNSQQYGNMVWYGNAVNPNLTWETSEQWNVGIDGEFFHNRLAVSVDYFDKRTKDLIQPMSIDWPGSIGLNAMYVNLGEVANRGVEIAASWNHRVNRDWTYYINGNFSYLHNEVVSTGVINDDGEPGVWTQGGGFRSVLDYIYQTRQGGPLFEFYMIKTDGIFQSDEEAAAYVNSEGKRIQPNAKAGDLKFIDYDGDGVITDGDRQYLGNADPKTTYALSFGATWKNLTLSAMFQGVGGAQAAYVGKSVLLSDVEGNFNRSAEILNAWSKDNPGSNIPRLSRNDPNGNFTTPSDWYLEDASYLRLKNVTINYDLTSLIQKCGHLLDRHSRLNVYLSADNLFTITKYSGVDPECGGWDAIKYPVSRVFSFGINLTY